MLAIDFETFYTKEYSLREMSQYDYVYDTKFNAHTVAVYGPDISWVGDPRKFDWSLIHGQTLLAHNASFDGLVLKRLRELGIVPAEFVEKEWLCTADLAAYLRCIRSLAVAAKELLGIDVDKMTREKLRDQDVSTFNAEQTQELHEYAIKDAKLCYMLAEKFLDKWPLCEREYSQRLRASCWAGIPVGEKEVYDAFTSLTQQRHDLERTMPWIAEGYTPQSRTALRALGRKEGIPVPASLAKDDDAANAWFKEFGPKYAWVQAFRDHISLNNLCNRVETIYRGRRADGTLALQIMYMGAHSGRTSAGSTDDTGGKFNPLNMPKKAMFGVNMRHLFVAPPGWTFIISDFAQIEARMLMWRVGDKKFLELLKAEGNIYQAYAKAVGWYKGTQLKKDDPKLYERTKVSVLQLGYQSGWKKFQSTAKKEPYFIEFTDQEATDLVNDYRRNNPLVVAYWDRHNQWLAFSANQRDATHEVPLKSGRDIVYFNPQWGKNDFGRLEMKVQTLRGGNFSKIYGGLATANEIQATARDVLRDARNAVERAGHKVVLDVYDEIVALVPESEAKDRMADIERLMVSSSPWAEGCPLGVEAGISKFYKK